MVQLSILSGKKAGTSIVTRRFPVRVGRAAGNDIQLEDHGVWDEHFRIGLNPGAGFVLETQPNALVAANSQPVERMVLKNGDLIEVGAVKLQFWLSESRQHGLRVREGVFWTIVIAVSLGQVALIYWLLG